MSEQASKAWRTVQGRDEGMEYGAGKGRRRVRRIESSGQGGQQGRGDAEFGGSRAADKAGSMDGTSVRSEGREQLTHVI